MSGTPREILQDYFGFPSFRGPQEEIIDHVTHGGDAVVLMPTGGGKSLCYQIPAIARAGTGIVVSPLIALMQDQVRGLVQMGVRAAYLNSSLSAQAAREVEDRFLSGMLDLLYVAPERAVQPYFLDMLSRVQLGLFAIDEAHCVSQWGHDFRPEYMQLHVLKERFPHVPRIALTATADGPTRRDILDRLELTNAEVFSTGFDRPNIRYRILPKDRAEKQLLDFIRKEHEGDCGIVYRMSRKKVEKTAELLEENGIRALPYHAGLDAATRDRHLDTFMREDGIVMVATVAFGMGVDKPDVRFVAHLEPPKSLEAYHQETGRAGRDGLPADAWMTYGLADIVALQQLMGIGQGEGRHKRIEAQKLSAMLGFCETATCRRQALLGYFGEDMPEPCGNCDTCLEPVDTFEGLVVAQKALSCIFRTGQRFGARHLTNVLLGKTTQVIERLGHDQVSTFGIGTELDDAGWRSVYRQLIARGEVDVDIEGHGSLRLNEESWAILRGEKDVVFRRDPVRTREKSRKKRERKVWADEYLQTPEEKTLWERLRKLRLSLAQEQEIPPYAVFHDATLLEMTLAKPESLDEFGRISGVGQAKLTAYGHIFLEELENHYAEFGVGEKRAMPAGNIKPKSEPKKDSATAKESLEMFRELGSVSAVAEARGLKAATIYRHLIPAVRRGELTPEEVAGISAEDAERIRQELAEARQRNEVGVAGVFEALGGAFDYDIIRCMQAGFRS